MALDKQQILNELGHVVNQLQSADCGCMGKMFSNSNQPNQNGGFQNAPMNPVNDGYMRGCCHGHGCGHGYNAPGAGEPFSGNRNCMGGGFCNPPKLYADTYNYLSNNLMQPVVKEVYDDLKSISPANTMMNNPMGAQMGLSSGNSNALGAMGGQSGNMAQHQMPGGAMGGQMGNMAQNQMPGGAMGGQMGNMGQNQIPGGAMGGQMGNMGQNQMPGGAMGGQMGNMGQNQMPGGAMGNQNAMPNQHRGPNVRFGNSNIGNPNSQQQMGQIAQPTPLSGMGPNIVNMMMGNSDAQRANNTNQSGSGTQGLIGSNAPQSPGMGQYNGGMPGNNPGQYNNMGMNDMRPVNPGAPMQNPNMQHMSQPNMYAGANTNMQGNVMNGQMGQINPGSQQMQAMSPAQPQMNAQNPGYGQHGAGMAKFNEMFPGVMQGGDLGFDPMAIAIQMNPANQQKAAMDTMQKMMMSNGKGLDPKSPLLQPVINATNEAMANIAQPLTNQAPGQQNAVPPAANAAAVPVQNNQGQPQQVYTAVTGAPTINQQQVPQQQIPTQQQEYQRQYQQQQNFNPITGLPTVYEGSENPNARQGGSPPTGSAPPATQQMIKDPIFPADTSRNLLSSNHFNKFKHQSYNTLGQPIDMMPADVYRIPEPSLPQTLSPQAIPRSDAARYSNVKATVSKTSLMGNRPIGRTPSRGQLQQIYNQYKGSQSYTQQNIRPHDNGASYSDGHLNVTHGSAAPQAPVERIGGDTATNNAMNNLAYAAGQKPGHGDVPVANKPLGSGAPAYTEKAPVQNSRVRNGLQDMKYTAYTTTAAWSFHGDTPAPQPRAYRFQYARG